MSKEVAAKNSKTSKSVVGTADESALRYPVMRLAQDMHRSKINIKSPNNSNNSNDNDELEMKIFEEISIDLENPFLYSYFRNCKYPNHTFSTLVDGVETTTTTTTTSTTTTATTTSTASTATTTTSDDHHHLDAMIKQDTTLSIAAKATTEDLQQMKARNDTRRHELVAAIQVATESAGDMEVLDAHIALAQYMAQAYGPVATIAAYETILALPKVSSGKKIDLLMAVARITSFYSDIAGTDDYLQRAMTLAEAGGGSDWDRRNRLKIYQALQHLWHRQIPKAAKLLLDCISTFNAVEYCTYQEFIVYTVLSNLLHLSRPELKRIILNGSEIITIGAQIPEIVRVGVNAFRSLFFFFFFWTLHMLNACVWLTQSFASSFSSSMSWLHSYFYR